MNRNVSSNSDAAAARQAAIAAARQAALEAAAARRAEAARQAAEAQRAAAAKQAQAPAATADVESVREARALQGGPQGDVPLPPPPGAAGTGPLLAAMAELAPPAAQAAEWMRALRGLLEGPAPAAAGAITGTMMDPSGYYQAAGALRGSPEMAGSEADVRAVAAMTTADNLAAKLREEPDLSKHDAETVKQLTGFREVANPALQSAIDHALETTFKGDLDPDQITKEMAYLAHTSTDSGVKDALADKMKDWADQALEKSLDGKEKDSGVEAGLAEFQEQMVALAERTGMGDAVQKAAEDALKDGEKLIEDTAKRGRSLWDKFTGAVSGFIDGAFGAIGDGIKKAISAVGDVAEFAVDKVGDVAELGLDVAAAGLDAVGLEGAADVTRQAGDAVDSAYDWVGKQAGGFVDGVGAALGDTVTGIGSTIAHPIETVKGVAHLVTHPGEIVTVGKALWAEASKGGVAHALGYVAGNIAPMLLTGGSSAGGSLAARVGAVAGESRLLTLASTAVKGSRAAQIASRLGSAGRLGEIASVAGRGLSYARTLAGKPVRFVTQSRFGRLVAEAGQGPRIQAIASRFRQARTALAESGAGQSLSRVKAGFERFKYDLNSKLDQGLARGLRRLDDTAVGEAASARLARGLGDDLVTRVDSKVAFNRAVGSDRARAFGERLDQAVIDEINANVSPEIRSRVEQSAEALGEGRAARGAGELDDFLKAEDAYEYLARERPEVLQGAIDGAYRQAGLDPAEVERFIHDYTTSSSRTNPEVFNRIKEGVVNVLDGKPPGNAEERMIRALLDTRDQRARYISEVTGVPAPDSYRVFRGTPREDTLQRVARAWRDGDASVQVADRTGIFSTSIDPAVAADFGIGGPRWQGTVGAGQAAPGGNFTVFDFDAPQSQVLFDKFVDGGNSVFGQAEQRVQREVLLAAKQEDLWVDASRAKISFNGRTYTHAERADLLEALEKAGVAL